MGTASASTGSTDMPRRPGLLAAAVVLFTAWIAYLAYLALTASHPVVLSRPQFFVAELWVAKAVAKIGAVKPIVVASASGSRISAVKLRVMPVNPIADRQTCAIGRLGRMEARPGPAAIQATTIGSTKSPR